MTAHIVATVRVSNSVKFGLYTKAVSGLAERFRGEYLVRGKVSEVLEGNGDADERVVILSFPDADAARAFYFSPEYQAAKGLRTDAALLEMRLLD